MNKNFVDKVIEPEKVAPQKKPFVFNTGFMFVIMTVLVFVVLFNLNFERLFARTDLGDIGEFIAIEFWPPNTSPVVRESIWLALVETIYMALAATYFGMIMSFPLSIMASKNLMPAYVSKPMRLILALIRTVPSLVWAILAVILFGLGPRSGVIALSIYTTGYLGKFQYETFEGLNSDAFEALKSVGASKVQIIRFAALPETANQLISQIIFMFEYNVRAGSIIGFVGAGGIGFLLKNYMGFFHFDAIVTTILFLLVAVVVIDYLGGKLREQYQDPNFGELDI